jgi:glycosyltransferase involved in cell wall biosynthesis
MYRPRILLLNSTLGIGGAENVIAALCRGLDRDQFAVTVAHLKWRGAIGDALAKEGYPVVGVGLGDLDRPNYLSMLRLRRFLASQQFDLIHTHDLNAMIDASFCRVTLPGVRQVNTFHFGNHPHRLRRYHLVEKYLSRVPDRLVAVGSTQRDRLVRVYGFKENRLRVIRNGVADVGALASRDLLPRIRVGDEIVIGSVSTLIEQKGITDLLDVAGRLHQQSLPFRLVIAGEGHLRPSLEAKVDAMGLTKHVEFLGWVDDAPSRVLPWIDIFVQTSLWEAMSMVVLEAMSCRLPVVATAVGENPHVIEDGRNGFLAAPGDVDRVAERLKNLIQSPELRRRMGAEARGDWSARYTARRMCEDYQSLYLETLGPGRRVATAA